MADPRDHIIKSQRDDIDRLKTVLRRQDHEIDCLKKELAAAQAAARAAHNEGVSGHGRG